MRHSVKDVRGSGPVPGPRPLIGLAAAALLLLWPAVCQAHGVEISCRQGPAMVAEAIYDDGDPLAYVKVRVMGPDGKTFQAGNTDGHGRFAWVPDRSGLWALSVADGMGHRAQLEVQAGPGQAPAPAAPAAQAEASRWTKAAWGLSALFFVFGLCSWVASRRRKPPVK
jgi:nickel transport protein